MKRFISISEKRSINKSFAILTSEEMYKVRGGGGHRPASRELDIFEDDPTRPRN